METEGAVIDKLYSVPELSAALQLSQRRIRQLVAEGKLPAFKLGGRYRFSAAQVNQYLAARQVQP